MVRVAARDEETHNSAVVTGRLHYRRFDGEARRNAPTADRLLHDGRERPVCRQGREVGVFDVDRHPS